MVELNEVWLVDYARTAFSRSRPRQPERDVFGEIRGDELLALLIKNMFEKFRNISFVNKEESKNIFTLIKAKKEVPNRPLVIMSAHYDSISANIPYKLQVIIFFIYRLIVYLFQF